MGENAAKAILQFYIEVMPQYSKSADLYLKYADNYKNLCSRVINTIVLLVVDL